MYAVIETGGKQYQVSEGDEIFIEKLPVEADAAVSFDKVIAIGAESGLTVGTPYVAGATVEAKVLKNGKAKKSEKTKMGHRQPYTKLKIEAIKA